MKSFLEFILESSTEFKHKPYGGRSNMDRGGFIHMYHEGKHVASGEFEMRGHQNDTRAVLPVIQVNEKHQGKGHGSTLLKHIEDEAKKRGAKHIRAQVVHAPEFFRKHGYVNDNPNNSSMVKQL